MDRLPSADLSVCSGQFTQLGRCSGQVLLLRASKIRGRRSWTSPPDIRWPWRATSPASALLHQLAPGSVVTYHLSHIGKAASADHTELTLQRGTIDIENRTAILVARAPLAAESDGCTATETHSNRQLYETIGLNFIQGRAFNSCTSQTSHRHEEAGVASLPHEPLLNAGT